MSFVKSGMLASPVAESRESEPAIACSMIAESLTVRVSGPTVSKLGPSGTTPCRLTRP